MCGRSYWVGFVGSSSLIVLRELNHIIVASRHMFTLAYMSTWINVGGGCYRVVLEHGSPLGLDRKCVGHEFMSIAYMCSLCLWYMYLLCMHGGGHGCSDDAM